MSIATIINFGLYTTGTVILLAAALHDLAFRTIPNWMPGIICCVGCLLRVFDNMLVEGMIAFLAVFLISGFCWSRAWLGGGDVKLIAASALLVPPALVVPLLLDVALAGGVLAMVYLIAGRLMRPQCKAPRPPDLLSRVFRVERHRIRRYGPLPYASAIAAGVMIVLS